MPKYNYFTCTLFIFFIECNKYILYDSKLNFTFKLSFHDRKRSLFLKWTDFSANIRFCASLSWRLIKLMSFQWNLSFISKVVSTLAHNPFLSFLLFSLNQEWWIFRQNRLTVLIAGNKLLRHFCQFS